MRHLIILPGNSLKNKAWGEAVLAHYKTKFDSVYLQHYSHWDGGEANINFETEEAKLKTHVAELSADVAITLVAKSAGSLLAFMAIYHGIITPAHCVFFGIPFDLAANNGGWQWSSSSGCDAQPYFRIFNPYNQSEKFDSDGEFIKMWIPELSEVSSKEIHRPDILKNSDYPAPIVSYEKNRKTCLEMYSVVRET
jgi:hypothetical protein